MTKNFEGNRPTINLSIKAQGAVIPPELMKCVPRAANNLGQAGLIEDIKMEDATEKVRVKY